MTEMTPEEQVEDLQKQLDQANRLIADQSAVIDERGKDYDLVKWEKAELERKLRKISVGLIDILGIPRPVDIDHV